MTQQTADIAIIGGGIVGLACAYELSLQGAGRIVLFDKMAPASGTTGGSGGVICRHDIGEIYAVLSLLGYARVRELAEENEFGYRNWTANYIVREPASLSSELDAYHRRFSTGRPGDLYHHENLDASELLKRCPWIKPEGISGAASYPNEGFVNPHELAMVYGRLAQATGRVEICATTPVLDIRTEGDRIRTIVTRRGAWSVGQVLNAGGPWGAKVAELAGSSLALSAQRIQVCLATTFDDGIDAPPLTGMGGMLDGEGVWCRGEHGNTMIFAEHRNFTRADREVDPDHVNRVNDLDFPGRVEKLYRECFHLPKSVFLNGWCCVYGSTEDGYPIVARDDRLENFYHAVGMNGHGITCSGGVCQMIAELMLRDSLVLDVSHALPQPGTLDFSGMDNARFERGELFDFELREERVKIRI
jgi:sarcosine oxidase subunit beta